MNDPQEHPLLTAGAAAGAMTIGLVAAMHFASCVAVSAWFTASLAALVCGAAVATIARPGHVAAAEKMREMARRWVATTHEAFVMGAFYGAATVVVLYELCVYTSMLFTKGHWAAAILCVGVVAVAFYIEADALNVMRSLSWRGGRVKRAA